MILVQGNKMLIINADDWGKDRKTTDNISICFKNDRITSATAMMFMDDSKRSAELAQAQNLPVGLHLNFTKSFFARNVTSDLKSRHNRLVKYFTRSKYARIIYNPLIQRQVEYCFKAQLEEFQRLYDKNPTHIDGHHHIHLCSNLIFSSIIPRGAKMRRNFSFSKREKSMVNRAYRGLIDRIIKIRFITTDFFYALNSRCNESDIIEKLSRIHDYNVEFMVHPGIHEEYTFIMSDEYEKIIKGIAKGSYESL